MSLRLKLVLSIGSLILMLGLGWTLLARLTITNLSEDELDKRALTIARDLEGRAGELILTNDTFSLYSHVDDLTSNNEDISYIVVFDAEGNVKASTFTEGLPAGLRDANDVPSGRTYSLASLKTSEGDLIDAAYLINDGRVGTIRIGMSTDHLQHEVNSLTYDMLALTAGVIAAALVICYILATLLTRPLVRLAEAAKAVGRGDLTRAVPSAGRDETGQVGTAFNQMIEQLLQRRAERTELLAKVLSAQEEERKRIARELHDEAGQALTSLLLGLKGLEDTCAMPEDKAKAGDLRRLTAETLDLMRDMALQLRPSTLDDLGLVPALQRYVADFGRKHGLETDFHPGRLEGVRLSAQAETALYRIAQEALTNIVRHAEAHAVSVLLDRRDGRATLVVEDDGKGFDPETVGRPGSASRKLGLLGMRERAALVGGIITIESRPSAGTTVFVEVPVEGGSNGTDQSTNS